jgi:hypothetical protein
MSVYCKKNMWHYNVTSIRQLKNGTLALTNKMIDNWGVAGRAEEGLILGCDDVCRLDT